MRLFTAGHSTVALDAFVGLMTDNGIDLAVDVRSKPRSRLPHFDQVPLEEALGDVGVRYRFLGEKLGGMPQDPRIAERWRQGHLDPVIVAHLRGTEAWQEGIAELVRLVQHADAAVCIVCSEGDPNECHRKAVALDAAEALPGLEIVHLTVGRGTPREVGVQEVMM